MRREIGFFEGANVFQGFFWRQRFAQTLQPRATVVGIEVGVALQLSVLKLELRYNFQFTIFENLLSVTRTAVANILPQLYAQQRANFQKW